MEVRLQKVAQPNRPRGCGTAELACTLEKFGSKSKGRGKFEDETDWRLSKNSRTLGPL